MANFKVGYFVGSLSTKSINRLLATHSANSRAASVVVSPPRAKHGAIAVIH